VTAGLRAVVSYVEVEYQMSERHWLSTTEGDAAARGMSADHKRVYRLYREEGLAMRIRQRRRIRWNGVVTNPAATRPNERWSMDFVSDCVSTGKVIRMLTMVDDCTRECQAIEIDTSLRGLRVRRVLDRIASERGLPEAIVLDNGPEFRGRALATWSEERGVRLEFIQPGKPVQNAYVKSFQRPVAR
jgi:putative transposase